MMMGPHGGDGPHGMGPHGDRPGDHGRRLIADALQAARASLRVAAWTIGAAAARRPPVARVVRGRE